MHSKRKKTKTVIGHLMMVVNAFFRSRFSFTIVVVADDGGVCARHFVSQYRTTFAGREWIFAWNDWRVLVRFCVLARYSPLLASPSWSLLLQRLLSFNKFNNKNKFSKSIEPDSTDHKYMLSCLGDVYVMCLVFHAYMHADTRKLPHLPTAYCVWHCCKIGHSQIYTTR